MAVLIHGREFFFLLTSLDGMFFSMELDSVVLKVSSMLSTSLDEISLGDSLLASSWSSVSMSSEMASKFAFSTKTLADGRLAVFFLASQDIRFPHSHDRLKRV